MLTTLGRKYPLMNGCGRIANLPGVRTMVDKLSGDSVSGTLRNGYAFRAPGSDFVARAAWMFGDLDPKLTAIANALVREGDTVVDIGANFGLFSLYASSMVGDSGQVHAVEPQTNLIDHLRLSLTLNQIHNVSLYPVALGEGHRIMKLHIRDGNTGAASFIRQTENEQTVPVPVQKSESFFNALPSNHVRFIKLDVEGFEGHVIRGALQYLRHHRPDALFVEAQTNRRIEDNSAIALLTEMGYQCHAVLPSMLRVRLAGTGYDGPLDGVHDILALAPGIRGVEAERMLTRAGIRFV